MSQNYSLSLKQQFEEAGEKQFFNDIQADLAAMKDARLNDFLEAVGVLLITVDNDPALQYLIGRHGQNFDFTPDNTMYAGPIL